MAGTGSHQEGLLAPAPHAGFPFLPAPAVAGSDMEAREEISEIDSGCTAWQEELLTPAADMRSPFPIPGNKKGAVKK